MSRILKERYHADRPKENGPLVIVQFGQTPQDRQQNFERFTRTLRTSCFCSSMPKHGGMSFASKQDYLNYLAVESLGRMKPFGDENFDAVERDFPIKFVQEGPAVW